MNTKLVLHERTKQQVAQYIKQPAHALLIVGPDGIGKGSVAAHLVQAILAASVAQENPNVRILGTNQETISVDDVRALQRFLQLKVPGTKPIRRAIVIEHAQGMTTEAQNAFLKILEEPPADTILILTINNRQNVLPTILSRAQTLNVHTPTLQSLQDYFLSLHHDQAKVQQALLMSGGLPGLAQALLSEDTTHPLVKGIDQAKQILGKTTFERLALVDSLSKQRDDAQQVLTALQRIAQATLAQAAKANQSSKIKLWHRILKHSATASEQLANSANTKLVLTDFMLHL